MEKRVSRSTSSSSSVHTTGLGGTVPAGVTGVFRRFWDYTKKSAKRFSKELKNPEEREAEFMKAVQKDSEHWI